MSDNSEIKDRATVEPNGEEKPREIHGGRNLIILSIGAILISIITTSISLAMYRLSGDIYLDRSRPGYISEGEKRSKDDDKQKTFSNEGEITQETIDEYLDEFDSVKGRIDSLGESFTAEQLSDEALGIYSFDEDFAELDTVSTD